MSNKPFHQSVGEWIIGWATTSVRLCSSRGTGRRNATKAPSTESTGPQNGRPSGCDSL